MGNLLEKAASPEVINKAWKRSKSDNAIWEPGLSRREMEWDVGLHLLRLSEDLRSGSYVPNPVRFFPVAKADGKQRIISAITLRDKVAQRAVMNVIEPIGERMFHHDSFGYRPGKNVDMAFARVPAAVQSLSEDFSCNSLYSIIYSIYNRISLCSSYFFINRDQHQKMF